MVGADVDGPLVGGAVVDSVVSCTVGGVVGSTKKHLSMMNFAVERRFYLVKL